MEIKRLIKNPVKDAQEYWLPKIEAGLDEYTARCGALHPELMDAMRYSLLDAGKRIRPLLTLEFCRAAGGDPESAMPFACAVEMIHSYSLVHDDLPCMDDDEMRRGKASCHVRFGEDVALQAGDALQALAFDVMLQNDTVSSDRTVKAAQVLAHSCGAAGMVGGQVIDLQNEGKQVDVETLRRMDAGKTGAIIKAACLMGVIVAGGDDSLMNVAETYAENIGIAFQITDDILDVAGDAMTLGKPVQSDVENNKFTYVSLLGLDKARAEAARYTALAVEAVAPLGSQGEFFVAFAKMLAGRIN